MNNPDEMDMPCLCDCGEWFDLLEGNSSLHSNKVICDTCSQTEEEEKEREEEIDNLRNTISDAEIDIKNAKERLKELGAK
jgi:hypothetical protein